MPRKKIPCPTCKVSRIDPYSKSCRKCLYGNKIDKYKNKEWLHEVYYWHEYSTYDLAKMCRVSQATILYFMDKYNIKRRASEQSQYTNRCYEKLSKSRKIQAGEANPHWKGGRFRGSNGYILIKAYGHPASNKNGYVLEHRLVAEP